MRADETCHVVAVPLAVNQREARILEQRLRVRGQLRNATLQTMLGRLEAMRRDPEWATARRLTGREQRHAYGALKERYQVSKREACNAAFGHWRASKWMPSVVDSRVALELGTELWQQVSAWMYGKTEKPRFKPSREMNAVWGADNHAGLMLRGRKLVWRNKRTPRKNVSLTLQISDREWQKRVEGRGVIRVGIKRERGCARWFALLCLGGNPYRSEQYLASIDVHAVVGIDAGPSRLAIVSAAGSETADLAPPDLLAERRHERQRLRRRQRALDRSRRATNPGCFDGRGRWRKGKKADVKSNRYQRLLERQSADARRAATHRRHDETALARRLVVEHGGTVVTEKLDFRAWPRSRYGKRTAFTAPGTALRRILREAVRVGGQAIELETQSLALSQHCLCGSRVKKDLCERLHCCRSCGLGPLDRDLFSAFLARIVVVEGVTDLSTGTLNGDGFRRNAQALCAPGEAPVPVRRSGGRQADTDRLASESGGQTPRTRSARVSAPGASRQAASTSAAAGSTRARALPSCAGAS